MLLASPCRGPAAPLLKRNCACKSHDGYPEARRPRLCRGFRQCAADPEEMARLRIHPQLLLPAWCHLVRSAAKRCCWASVESLPCVWGRHPAVSSPPARCAIRTAAEEREGPAVRREGDRPDRADSLADRTHNGPHRPLFANPPLSSEFSCFFAPTE